MQDMMLEKGFLKKNDDENTKNKQDKGKNTTKKVAVDKDDSMSETMIYKDAVQKVIENDPEITFNFKNDKRDSSSSEERINTSDELMEIDVADQFIADCANQGGNKQRMANHNVMTREGNIETLERSQQVIHEAEANKARLFATKGNGNLIETNWDK